MNVLVIGGGGREHALAWKMAQSPKLQQVYVAPGNGGTARDKNLINVPITDVQALRQWAQDNQIVLTVVGPEAPLAAGVVDEFRARVTARLVLLPRDDPQFRRNRERIVRDAERENILLEWDLGLPEEEA